MKIKINDLAGTLNKIAFIQVILLSLIGIIYLFYKQYEISTGIVISGLASFSYTQLLRFSCTRKIFALFGFPIRLLLIVPPCAILVHKLHSNLIALFLGFTLSQLIYFLCIWGYIKEDIKVEK